MELSGLLASTLPYPPNYLTGLSTLEPYEVILYWTKAILYWVK